MEFPGTLVTAKLRRDRPTSSLRNMWKSGNQQSKSHLRHSRPAFDLSNRIIPGPVKTTGGRMEFPGMLVTAKPRRNRPKSYLRDIWNRGNQKSQSQLRHSRPAFDLSNRIIPGPVKTTGKRMEFPGRLVIAKPRRDRPTSYLRDIWNRGNQKSQSQLRHSRPTFDLSNRIIPGPVKTTRGRMEFPGRLVTAIPRRDRPDKLSSEHLESWYSTITKSI